MEKLYRSGYEATEIEGVVADIMAIILVLPLLLNLWKIVK